MPFNFDECLSSLPFQTTWNKTIHPYLVPKATTSNPSIFAQREALAARAAPDIPYQTTNQSDTMLSQALKHSPHTSTESSPSIASPTTMTPIPAPTFSPRDTRTRPPVAQKSGSDPNISTQRKPLAARSAPSAPEFLTYQPSRRPTIHPSRLDSMARQVHFSPSSTSTASSASSASTAFTPSSPSTESPASPANLAPSASASASERFAYESRAAEAQMKQAVDSVVDTHAEEIKYLREKNSQLADGLSTVSAQMARLANKNAELAEEKAELKDKNVQLTDRADYNLGMHKKYKKDLGDCQKKLAAAEEENGSLSENLQEAVERKHKLKDVVRRVITFKQVGGWDGLFGALQELEDEVSRKDEEGEGSEDMVQHERLPFVGVRGRRETIYRPTDT